MKSLERGRGAEAASILVRVLRQPGLHRDEQVQIRCALAEAWLLQDDVRRATEALGAPPEGRERRDPARLSDLWRIHGRLAVARGEPSRGIAFLTKALNQADRAHDSRAIGLAHYELGLCYRQVGDIGIVREHITKAASALHAAGDRRHLAMVHSLSGVTRAQEGRLGEAVAALRQAERLAVIVEAFDVLATVCGNQANVALMQHRHEQALALAERSVDLQQHSGTPHGLGVALASLGQICVRLGNLKRAEDALNRALDVRSPLHFMRETTGAVFDTLAQIHLIRGQHDEASRCLEKAREAYGPTIASRWYQWSVRALEARLALRRGDASTALAISAEVAGSSDAPPIYVLQAELIAIESLLALGRMDVAEQRLDSVSGRVEPGTMSGTWGEFLRMRGRLHAAAGRATEAYHDFGQSVSVFDLLGEGYQSGLSYLELGRLAAAAGARSRATRYLTDAASIFETLGAAPDLADARAALNQ
ncbi:MAG: tetratricopeptide repeat protein, partial [Vicinamibacterales bacterium]